VLSIAAVITLVIAAVDWWTKPYVSLGFLYLFPIMMAAAFLSVWVLRRWTWRVVHYFVGELVRNRRLNMESQARLQGPGGQSGGHRYSR
jgi:hypothetical protein